MAALSDIELTPRDRSILSLLTLRVRAISLATLADRFWPESPDRLRAARRRVTQLAKAGLLNESVVLAHPEIELPGAVAAWSPGAAPPNADSVSYQLKRRWTEPVRKTPIVIASRAAGAWLGGHGGRLPRPSEATHDLHLTLVYLQLERRKPEAAKRWVSEATLLSRGEAGRDAFLPDAVIKARNGNLAVEFGGAYSAAKVRGFHESCVESGLAYEIW